MLEDTRQGCTQSPLLYILTMEPLAVALRLNPDLQGVVVARETYKLALYVDDLLLYVTSPMITIPKI